MTHGKVYKLGMVKHMWRSVRLKQPFWCDHASHLRRPAAARSGICWNMPLSCNQPAPLCATRAAVVLCRRLTLNPSKFPLQGPELVQGRSQIRKRPQGRLECQPMTRPLDFFGGHQGMCQDRRHQFCGGQLDIASRGGRKPYKSSLWLVYLQYLGVSTRSPLLLGPPVVPFVPFFGLLK